MPQQQESLILASSSPRRADLLRSIGADFEIATAPVPEAIHPGEAPADYITRLARAKAVAIARTRDSGLIIGADTVVVLDGRTMGKPADEDEAKRMLGLLAGRWHAVMTGVAVYHIASRREAADYAKTLVRFTSLSQEDIDWYVKSGEPMDKAGAYAIQGLGSLFVEEIAGNYSNVVGLPITLVYRLCRQLGFSLV